MSARQARKKRTMEVVHLSEEEVTQASIDQQETDCLVDCFKRHCVLTGTPLNLARIFRIVEENNSNKYEYWVDQDLPTMNWIMGRDLVTENGQAKLIIIYPLRLQDGRRDN